MTAYANGNQRKTGIMYKITELRGRAYHHALALERECEWDNKRTYCGNPVTEKDLVDYSLMSDSYYDENGNWVSYGKENI